MSSAVRTHALDAWHTVAPERDNGHGPLPAQLVLLTVVTGLVDAFSYLELGRVFVANMTGNVVFLSFDLGGASGFVWWASVLAILMFVLGAFFGGRMAHTYGGHRGRHLLLAASLQGVLVLAAFVVALCLAQPYGAGAVVALVVLLGIGMGLQNATARALAVPDLTTTVLTLTLTGISADSAAAGGKGSKLGRRAVSIVSMFVGGAVGAVLVETHHGPWSLLVALALLGLVIALASRTVGSSESWTARR
jgi:uncharacterized membrane protein YoaK (UPF0700 family)